MDTLFVGIAGGSGSGKTTLVDELKKRCGTGITVISHDSYYKAREDISFEERTQLNYDEPDAFETELMASHIRALKQGFSVDVPVYDFKHHTRSNRVTRTDPCPVILVEGILLFACPEITELMDVKIFVDVDSDIRIIRRILRDVEERGRSLDSVVRQYMTTVKPMHEKYVEPSKKCADLVVSEGGRNEAALDLLVSRIRRHIDECK